MRQAALAAACVLSLGRTCAAGRTAPTASSLRSRARPPPPTAACSRSCGGMACWSRSRPTRARAGRPLGRVGRTRELPVNLEAVPDDWWGGEARHVAAASSGRRHAPGRRCRRRGSTARSARRGSAWRPTTVRPNRCRCRRPIPTRKTAWRCRRHRRASNREREPRLAGHAAPGDDADGGLRQGGREDAVGNPQPRTLEASAQGGGAPGPPGHRRGVVSRADGRARWTASYIEAGALVPAPAPATTGMRPRDGLHRVDAPERRRSEQDAVQLTARMTYCDRLGVKYMLPFGRIHVGPQQYWVYQFSGFDQEWYEVARMSPLKMAFVVDPMAAGANRMRLPEAQGPPMTASLPPVTSRRSAPSPSPRAPSR